MSSEAETDSNDDYKEDNSNKKKSKKNKKKKKKSKFNLFGGGGSSSAASSNVNISTNRYFGTDLSNVPSTKLPNYDSGIPKILVNLFDKLIENNGHLEEGIFRKAPNQTDNNKIKFLIENDKIDEIDFNTIEIHILSNLIKVFIRDLPKPLLCPTISIDDIEKSINTSLLPTSNEESNEELISSLILSMNEPNKSVFLWLLDLCVFVCKHKDENKMGFENMAIVISPNLYNPMDIPPNKIMMASQHVTSFTKIAMSWRSKQ